MNTRKSRPNPELTEDRSRLHDGCWLKLRATFEVGPGGLVRWPCTRQLFAPPLRSLRHRLADVIERQLTSLPHEGLP